jgi:hypothetical protein
MIRDDNHNSHNATQRNTTQLETRGRGFVAQVLPSLNWLKATAAHNRPLSPQNNAKNPRTCTIGGNLWQSGTIMRENLWQTL